MPKKKQHPVTLPKAPVASEADTLPADWATWTRAQKQAWWDTLDDASLNATPTAEELAMAERFMDKQESAHVGPAKPSSD